jgi:hypothetical protein
MKAYVNVLILFFWINYTNTQEKNWSHDMENLPCSNQKCWNDFSVYLPDEI